jgi:predicted transcriptional regulator
MLQSEERAALRGFAHALLDADYSIIPIAQDKRPNFAVLPEVWSPDENRFKATWLPFQARIAEHEEVDVWIDHPLTYGIAVVCGEISGGLGCIDFDRPEYFEQWFATDQAKALDAEQHAIQQTGSQVGRQVFLRGVWPNHNQQLAFAPTANAEGEFEIAIETRGEGGYAIIAPSVCLLGKYRWLQNDLLGLQDTEQAVWDTHIHICQAFDDTPHDYDQGEREVKPSAPMRNGGQSAIDWYNENTDIRSVLVAYGYDPRGYYRMARPGGKSASVSLRANNRSKHHSSNDDLFTPPGGGCHSPFSVYAFFEHGGDYKAAARHIWENLMGNQRDSRYERELSPASDVPPAEPEPATNGVWQPNQWPPMLRITQLDQIPPSVPLLAPYLFRNSAHLVFGASGTYKSFEVTAWCIDLALNHKATVCYVAAEDPAGYRDRVRARAAYLGLDLSEIEDRYLYWYEPVPLLSTSYCHQFAKELRPLGVDLIVFDTLHACFFGQDPDGQDIPGDTSSDRDMGLALRNAGKIRRYCNGAATLFVHHTTKSGQWERGSASLIQGVDVAVRFDDEDEWVRCLTEKTKNAERPAPRYIELVPSLNSMVTRPTEPFGRRPFMGKFTGTQYKVLTALQLGIYDNENGAATRDIIENVALPRSAVARGLTRLLQWGFIKRAKRDDHYRITDRGLEALGDKQAVEEWVPDPLDDTPEPESPAHVVERMRAEQSSAQRIIPPRPQRVDDRIAATKKPQRPPAKRRPEDD